MYENISRGHINNHGLALVNAYRYTKSYPVIIILHWKIDFIGDLNHNLLPINATTTTTTISGYIRII